MAHRFSPIPTALAVALCSGACLLACTATDDPPPPDEAIADATPLPPPLTVAPGAVHAYLFDEYLSGFANVVGDEGLGFGLGEAAQNDPGQFSAGATLVAHGSGSAVALTSPSAHAQFPYDVGRFGTGDFTVIIDYAGTSSGPDADLVTNRDVDNHANFFNMRMLSGGRVLVEVDQDTNGTNYNNVSGGAINDGQWHRIAAVRQGTQLSLVIDGVLVATQRGPGIANLQAYNSSGYGYNAFRIGSATFGNRAPTGTFDNLTVYDRALTAAELAGVAAPPAFQDFDTAPSAWTNVSGTWTWGSAAQSLTVATGYPGAVTWLPGLAVSDASVETRLVLDDSAGYAGLLLRGRNFTATNNGGQQYYVALFPGGVIVGKNDNGWTELGQATAPVTPGTYNKLRVEAIGSTLDIYVDDVLTLSVNDGSYATGAIGLKSFYGGATFDYVHVLPDLARGKAATQSSTDFGGVPSRAVDGNNDGVFADGSITHTQTLAGHKIWQVDLGQISSVDHVTIWSRAASDCPDCANRLQNYAVGKSVDGVGWTYQYVATVPQRLVVPINAAIRYVRVDAYSYYAEPLSLAEVTAWGTACGPDQIAGAGGSCAACPAGLVTTDGATCVPPTPLSPFGGADYVSRLVAVSTGQCMVSANTGTVHPQSCGRHSDGWLLHEVTDAAGNPAYVLGTGTPNQPGRCLVADAPGADGTATVHTPTDGCTRTSDLWNLQWNASGQLQFHNEQTGLCLAIAPNGAIVQARACTGESDELWNPDTLRSASVTSPLTVSTSGLCLQLAANGSPQLQPCQPQPTAAQALQLTSLDDGSFLIMGDGSHCLGLNASAPNGGQLVSDGCIGGDEDRWAMIPIDGGGVSLASLATGYCVSFPSLAAGVIPTSARCTGAANQILSQTHIGSTIPMRISLQSLGGANGAALVISSQSGAHVTTDPRAIAVILQEGGVDLNDSAQLQQVLGLLNDSQQQQLTAALSGPDGMTGAVTFNWYPYTPIASSISGTYNGGADSGTFYLRPFAVGGTNTVNAGYGFSGSIDWNIDVTDPESLLDPIDGFELDSPIGALGLQMPNLQSVLATGQLGVSVELGTVSLGLSLGINGINYTGPGDTLFDSSLQPYVNMYGSFAVQSAVWREALDVFTASPAWFGSAYAQVATSIAGFATDLTSSIASGYGDLASAVGDIASGVATAIDGIEHFWGML